MNAGRLDKRVSLMQPSAALGASGDPHAAESFTEFVTRRAEVKHLRGTELDRGRALHEEVQTKITVRYDSKTKIVTSDWRIHIGQEVYDILAPIPVPGGRPEKIEIFCKSHG